MRNKRIRMSILATRLGLPLAKFLDASRTALGIKCPYCQFYTQILRQVNLLGESRVSELLGQILQAKLTNNEAELIRLKKEFNNGSR